MAIKKTKKTAAKPTEKATKPKGTKSVTKTAKPKVSKTIKPAEVKTTSSSTEMRVSGKKMIGTLQKEFMAKFPYLRLRIFPYSEKNKSTKTSYSKDVKIGDVRKKDSAGEVSINGRKLVKNLESDFEKVFGLYAQVCFTLEDGKKHYTSGDFDEMSLTQLNAYGEKAGWQKGATD